MIVFRNYFKVLKKQKGVILLYTGILLLFTLFSSQSNNNVSSFSAVKPDVAVINLDEKTEIVDNFYDYLKENSELMEIENDDEKIDDALFYQQVDAVIYIYDGYSKDYLNNQEKELKVKYGTNAFSSYASMLLEKYFKVANISNDTIKEQDKLIDSINKSLKSTTNVEVKSTLDTTALETASYFYTYSNYSILSICIYITAIILLRFNQEKIRKRNVISSKKNSSIIRELYLANLCFGFIVWICLNLLALFIIGSNILFSINGLWLIINSFIFMLCALSAGFLIGNIINSENAISAIVNVVGLGTSFICGSFIPVQYLPELVVKYAKIFPSYWYIKNNDLIKTIESFNMETIKPLLINMVIVIVFAIVFFIISNIISRKKRKIS